MQDKNRSRNPALKRCGPHLLNLMPKNGHEISLCPYCVDGVSEPAVSKGILCRHAICTWARFLLFR